MNYKTILALSVLLLALGLATDFSVDYAAGTAHPRVRMDVNFTTTNYTEDSINYNYITVSGESNQVIERVSVPEIMYTYEFTNSTTVIGDITVYYQECHNETLPLYIPEVQDDGTTDPRTNVSRAPGTDFTSFTQRYVTGKTDVTLFFTPASYYGADNVTYLCNVTTIEIANATRSEMSWVNTSITALDDTVEENTTFSIYFDATNSGELNATELNISLSVPDGFTQITSDCTLTGTLEDHTQDSVTCQFWAPDIATNQTTYMFNLTGSYKNSNNDTITVSGSEEIIVFAAPDIVISTNSIYLIDESAEWKNITISNEGNGTAYDITFEDHLFDVAIPSDYGSADYNSTTYVLNWTIGDLAPGADTTVSYYLTHNTSFGYTVNQTIISSYASYYDEVNGSRASSAYVDYIYAPAMVVVNLTKEYYTNETFSSATLYLVNTTSGNVSYTQTTSSAGIARFGVEAREYNLTYIEYSEWEQTVDLSVGETENVNFSIPYSNTTFNAYLNSTEKTLVDATFRLYYNGSYTYESSTSSLDVPALTYEVNTTYDDYHIHLENKTLVQGNDKEINITIPATDAIFTVQNGFGANDVIENATIRFYTDTGVDTEVELLTNASGKVSVTLPQATYNVTVSFNESTYTTQATLNAFEQNITINLPLMNVTFSAVFDANEQSSAGNVTLYLDNGTLQMAQCDATGSVEVTDLVYGDYTIDVDYYGKNYTITDYLPLGQDTYTVELLATDLDLSVAYYVNETGFVYPSAGGVVQIYRNNTYLYTASLDANGTADITLPQDNYTFRIKYCTNGYVNQSYNLNQNYMSDSLLVNDVITDFEVDSSNVFYVNSAGWIEFSAESLEVIDAATIRVYSATDSTTYPGSIMDKIAYLYKSITVTSTDQRWYEVVVSSNNTEKRYLREMTISDTLLLNSTVHITGDLIVGGGGSGSTGIALFVNSTSHQVGIGTGNPQYALDVNGSINTNENMCIDGDCIAAWTDIASQWSEFGSDIYYSSGNVGIGTSSPSQELDIEGDIELNGELMAETFSELNGDDRFYIDAAEDAVKFSSNVVLNDARSLIIRGNGYGIHWGESSADAPQLYSDGTYFRIKANDGSNAFHMDGSGNVGIGTTDPGATLEVDGTSKFNGVINTNNQWISGDGGNEGLYVDDTGKVGIGTSAPATKLQVGSTSGQVNKITFGSSDAYQIGNYATGLEYMTYGSNGYGHRFTDTQGHELMYLDAGNNLVGIGTTSPGAKLDTAGFVRSTNEGGAPTSGTGIQMFYHSSQDKGYLTAYDYSASSYEEMFINNAITIQSDGDVGIGTTTPDDKLDVQGNVRLTGNLVYDGPSTLTIDQQTAYGALRLKAAANSYMTFLTNGENERMRIDAAGNIGIGTTSPSSKLQVMGTTRVSQSDTSKYVNIAFEDSNNRGSIYAYNSGSREKLQFQGDEYEFECGAGTAGCLTVQSDGDVGIGTTSPNGQLDIDPSGYNISPDSNGDDLIVQGFSPGISLLTNNDGQARIIFGEQSDSTKAMIGFYSYGDDRLVFSGGDHTSEHMVIHSDGDVGIGTNNPISKFDVNGDARFRGELDMVGVDDLLFNVNGYGIGWGTATNPSPRIYGNNAGSLYFKHGGGSVAMTIESSGEVGIGTTSPVDKLHVAGDMRVGTGSNGCVKDTEGDVIAGTCSSDIRLKKDIQLLDNSLEKVVHLKPVTYKWRAEEYPEMHFGDSTNMGLIAQQVEKVLPELVSEDSDGFKRVKYGPELTMLLINALQEQQDEIETLKVSQKITSKETDTLQAENKVLKGVICKHFPKEDICAGVI